MVFIPLSPEEELQFEELYNQYKPQTYAYACHLLGRYHYHAEDVIQTSFLSIGQHLQTVLQLTEAAQKSYIFKTVRHDALRILKYEKPSISLEDAEYLFADLEYDGVWEGFCMENGAIFLTNAIHTLPEGYQKIFSLMFLNQMDLKEISMKLGLKYDTAKKQYERGKKLLRKITDCFPLSGKIEPVMSE